MEAGERWRILRLHVEDQIPLVTLVRECGISERTLQRWASRYRQDGYRGLEDRQRADRGSRRIDIDLTRLVEALALTKPRPSIATIHRKVQKHCNATGRSAPSYSTVRSIVAGLDPGMLTLALEGPASYRDKHELVLRRRADRPNELWQADHTMLDLYVLDHTGKPVRPWLTTVLDDHSRAVCGYMVFLGAPSAANTALALHQAIWHKPGPGWPQCGIPEVLYTDHGSDFISHRIGQTMNDLHVRVIHSAVARPQGRGKIERFFGTINTELLPTLPGHLPPQRSEDRTARRPASTPTLKVADLDEAIGSFIRSYNDRTHRETEQSPNEAWVADGWLPRLPESLEELDGLLLTVATIRTVQRDGIHFQGLRYTAPTLAPYVRTTVTIRYDPRDISAIRVFHHDTFLCTAVDPDRARESVSLRDIQAARAAHRRALRNEIHERVALFGPTHHQPDETTNSEPTMADPRPTKNHIKLRTYEEDS